MKRYIAVMLVCAAPVLAQTQTAKKTKKAAARQSPAESTIPKGAVFDPSDGTYHYTDKQGRKWGYRMLPMGVSRWEEKPSSPQPAPQSSNRLSDDPNMKAIDQVDMVRFERTTPFGPQSWVKKKSELNDDERSVLSKAAAQNNDKKAQN